jgi:CheY-like chemotaxis protein
MGKKILIADDEPEIRKVIKLSLGGKGYELYEAKDGREALEMATALKPDLVILDIMMPGMIGYRVCQELKNNPETKHIIVVFLTARSTNLTDEAATEAGGDDYIPKPFLPGLLRDRIKQWLGE